MSSPESNRSTSDPKSSADSNQEDLKKNNSSISSGTELKTHTNVDVSQVDKSTTSNENPSLSIVKKEPEEKEKTDDESSKNKTIYKKGDIVWVDLGEIKKGSHIYGKERPSVILRDNELGTYAVVVQNDMGNRFSHTVILAPITSTEYEKPIPCIVQMKHLVTKFDNFEKKGSIKLDQILTVDKKYLKNLVGSLNKRDLQRIDRGLIVSFGIQP